MSSTYVLFCIVTASRSHCDNIAIVIISVRTRKRQETKWHFFNNFDFICFLLSRCPLLAWRKMTRHHGSASTATQTAGTRAAPLRANKPAETSSREVRKTHFSNAVTWELQQTNNLSLTLFCDKKSHSVLTVDSLLFLSSTVRQTRDRGSIWCPHVEHSNPQGPERSGEFFNISFRYTYLRRSQFEPWEELYLRRDSCPLSAFSDFRKVRYARRHHWENLQEVQKRVSKIFPS